MTAQHPARLELLVHADPGTPLADTLAEIGHLSEYDPVRLRLTAAIAQWWAQQMIERAAVIEADRDRDQSIRDRAAATRAAKRAKS